MKKILISLLLFAFTLPIFANSELEEILEEVVIELENTTELLQETKDENELLRQEVNDKDYRIQQLIIDNSILQQRNNYLTEDNDDLRLLVGELTDALDESNEIIIELRNELELAQEEINFFRGEFEDYLISPGPSVLALGLGITYPAGTEGIVTFDVPFLRILRIYARAGVQNSLQLHGGFGIIIKL